MSRLAALSLILIAACAPTRPTLAPLAVQQAAAQPSDAPVALFEATKPACAYDEIATVRVKSNTLSQTDDQLAQKLRAEARILGGDAVVGITAQRMDERDRRNDDGTLSNDHSHELAGTVVRFKVQNVRCSTSSAQ